MAPQKRLYAMILLAVLVVVGLLLAAWLAGSFPTGRFNVQRSAPHITQSAADAAAVLSTWLTDHWASDGAIVACTLTLSRQDSTESNWTFQVYSRQKNRLLVAVVQDQDVKVLRDLTSLYPQSVLPDTVWRRDSQSILDTWWRAGGATAWNNPEAAMMTLRLGMREDGTPSWQLTLTTKDISKLEHWEIEVDNGTLLEHSTTGGQQ